MKSLCYSSDAFWMSYMRWNSLRSGITVVCLFSLSYSFFIFTDTYTNTYTNSLCQFHLFRNSLAYCFWLYENKSVNVWLKRMFTKSVRHRSIYNEYNNITSSDGKRFRIKKQRNNRYKWIKSQIMCVFDAYSLFGKLIKLLFFLFFVQFDL